MPGVFSGSKCVPGAGSSLFGSSAFFGVIKLITRRGREVGGVEMSGLAGTQSTWGGPLTTGRRIGSGSEHLVPATTGRADGNARLFFPAFSDVSGGMARDSDAAPADPFAVNRDRSQSSGRQFRLKADYAFR